MSTTFFAIFCDFLQNIKGISKHCTAGHRRSNLSLSLRCIDKQLTVDNVQLTMMVSPLATYFNHFRRKYNNCQLSIVNCQFAPTAQQTEI